MKREALTIACCSDIAGKVRGKAFPTAEFDRRLQHGVGWTPTNVQITCFDLIADSPFGALGDLALIPDPATRVKIETDDDLPIADFVLGDIQHTDGRPWVCCTRSILKAALARLYDSAGLTLMSAFEHEFQFLPQQNPIGRAYTSAGFQAERRYAETLFAAMRDAGLKPDTFMKEYGVDQYEVTMGPQQGITAADHAVILRELAGITAQYMEKRISFTPLRDPSGVGNGVHIHMSLLDRDGNAVAYYPQGEYGLSAVANSFIAGILKYLDSIVALTAPSIVSYTRLTPHRWSAAFNNLGFRDREAAVRICPVFEASDLAVAAQFNFEFRAGDAAASPYLQLAAIVHAGTQGIEEELKVMEATEEDLSLLSAEELARRGYVRLPENLQQALRRFSDNATVAGWFPDGFADIYLKHKKGEIAFLHGKSEPEICAAYEDAY